MDGREGVEIVTGYRLLVAGYCGGVSYYYLFSPPRQTQSISDG